MIAKAIAIGRDVDDVAGGGISTRSTGSRSMPGELDVAAASIFGHQVSRRVGQEYQGYMTRPGKDGYRQAEQTREYEENKVIW